MNRLAELQALLGRDPAAEPVRVTVIVLAAGRSLRMGAQMKLLLPVAGEPMIRRTVRNALGLNPVELVVVTGHQAAAVTAALDGLPVTFAHNPDYAEGQPGSVAAGARALTQHTEVAIVMLGDQPLVSTADLSALVARYVGLDQDRTILVPHHQGRRGNPVLFAARHLPAIAEGGLNVGCRKLIETMPETVASPEFDSDAYTFDCDTPEDYARLCARIETS